MEILAAETNKNNQEEQPEEYLNWMQRHIDLIGKHFELAKHKVIVQDVINDGKYSSHPFYFLGTI